VAQGEFDHLPHLADLLAQSPDVLVVHLGDLRRLLLHRLLGDLDLRVLLDDDGVCARREGCDHEVELAAHHAHRDDVPAGDRAPPEHLGHVLLAPHDPDRLRGGEAHLFRGLCERPAEADLVVDPHSRVPPLDAVHADDPAVRVFRIPTSDASGGRLRALDEDDVPLSKAEDLHHLRIDPDEASAGIRRLRLRDPQELLTTRGQGSTSSG